MNQSSQTVDRHAKMLDETVRRVVTSVPDKVVDIAGLRSELAKALLDGSTTLFHLYKVGREFASRPAEPAGPSHGLVDRAWFKDRITGHLFELGWQIDGKPAFIRAVDRTNRPAKPSPQQIADMCRGAEKMRSAL